MNTLQQLAAQIEAAEATRNAIGSALTTDQQIALSSKAFIVWAKTEEGRTAIRNLVDKFTGAAK